MEFLKNKAITKDVGNGITVDEYCAGSGDLPIDGAVVHYRSGTYPWKKNRDIYELFFVLNGKLTIETEKEKHTLSPNDMFIVQPGIKHTSYAENADVLIVCNPPFDLEKMVFC